MSSLVSELEALRSLVTDVATFASAITDGLYEAMANSIASVLPIEKAQLDAARDAIRALIDAAWRLYVEASRLIGLPASPLAFSIASAATTRATLNMIRARLSLMNVIKIAVLVGVVIMARSIGRDTSRPVKQSMSFVSQPDAAAQSNSQSLEQYNTPVSPFMSQPITQSQIPSSSTPSPLQSQLERQLAFALSNEGINQSTDASIQQSTNPSKFQLLSLLTGVTPDIATSFASTAADYWESARQLWSLISMMANANDPNTQQLVKSSAALVSKLAQAAQ